MIMRIIKWLGLHDYLVLAAFAFIALGAWGFAKLMSEVREGDTQNFDQRIMQFVGAHRGSQEIEEMGRDITALGGVAVLSLVTIFAVAFLMMRRMWHAMWLLLAATCGGAIVTTIIKAMVDTAKMPGRDSHNDRRLAFELCGIYTPRQRVELDAAPRNIVGVVGVAMEEL